MPETGAYKRSIISSCRKSFSHPFQQGPRLKMCSVVSLVIIRGSVFELFRGRNSCYLAENSSLRFNESFHEIIGN